MDWCYFIQEIAFFSTIFDDFWILDVKFCKFPKYICSYRIHIANTSFLTMITWYHDKKSKTYHGKGFEKDIFCLNYQAGITIFYSLVASKIKLHWWWVDGAMRSWKDIKEEFLQFKNIKKFAKGLKASLGVNNSRSFNFLSESAS